MENHRNKKIMFLRSDRGEEYLSYEFGLHLKQCGIVSQLTPPGTPHHKCPNVITILYRYGAIYDVSYRSTTIVLGLCIRDSCIHVKNRAPSKSVETTPCELRFSKKPKFSFLKILGLRCLCEKVSS